MNQLIELLCGAKECKTKILQITYILLAISHTAESKTKIRSVSFSAENATNSTLQS